MHSRESISEEFLLICTLYFWTVALLINLPFNLRNRVGLLAHKTEIHNSITRGGQFTKLKFDATLLVQLINKTEIAY